MLAVDTNVVLRILLNDDTTQADIARRLVASHDIWVPLTVLLEAEWVLRSAASAITSQANFSAKIRQKVLVNCLFRQVTEGDELPI